MRRKESGEKMKCRVAGLFAVVLIALAALGFSYAWWTETLTINGNVNTGDLNVKFVWKSYGYWQPIYWYHEKPYIETTQYPPYNYPDPWQGDTLTISLSKLYPCPSVQARFSFVVVNIGTIPAKVKDAELTISGDAELASYILKSFNVRGYSARDPVTGRRTELWSESRGGWISQIYCLQT